MIRIMADDDSNGSAPATLWREARRAIGGQDRQRGAPSLSPVERYLDPERHASETAALRGLPHAIAPLARLAAEGDWLSTSLLGVPVLVSRGDDGVLRAFINVCRHRGARVAPADACGSGRSRFVCPYHSWTYDSRGSLVGRPHEDDFPHAPREERSLVPLPVAVRCGLVWVVPRAMEAFDWDDYFGPLAAELQALGFDAGAPSPHERRFVQPSNWKLVLDANLESYHFQYAHRATIAHLFHDNVVQQASFGRHQRIVLPKRTLAESAVDDDSVAGWEQLGRHSNVIYYFFPGTFVLWEGDHANVFNVTPETSTSCATASWMIVPGAQHALRSAAHWERNWKIFWDAIDEDFALAASMQAGLATGANAALTFGTNEFACELFERAVDELVGDGLGAPRP